MADFNFEIDERESEDMPFIIVYGGPGLGKSTFASQAPDAIFIQTENAGGELKLKTMKRGVFTSYDEVMAALRYLYKNPDVFKTLVIDSLDHLEPLVVKHTLETNGWKSINEGAYGAGYVKLEENWRALLSAIKRIVVDKKKIFIGIAHGVVRTVNDPTVEPYDSHEMKLNKRVLPLLKENADVIGFMNTPIVIDNKTGRAKGGSSVAMFVRPNAAYEAKTRYSSMPSMIQMNKDDGWSKFSSYIPLLNGGTAVQEVDTTGDEAQNEEQE